MLYTPTPVRRSIDEAAAAAAAAAGAASTPRFFVSAGTFTVQTGAPTLSLAFTAGDGHVWLLDPNTSEGVTTNVELPDGWNTFHADLWWANASTGTGDARMRVLMNRLDNGSATETAVASGAGTVLTAGAQNSVIKSRIQTGLTASTGTPHVLRVLRNATDAADTLANDVAFIGVELVRAS